ncbi:MAG TPA: hypothetical protein PKY59_12810 [Pyrinomonadaceae bacterium]|nr:hypothetical protein [Pyrinomonadaceae bacterium]
MSNLKIEIQIPSGASIDVTPTNAMPIIRGLLDGTEYIPELVTNLRLTIKTNENKTIQLFLSPVDGFEPVIETLDS